MSILEKIWKHADEKFAELMQNKDDENLKGYLRGLAFTLKEFMHPYFASPDDVARELRTRYKAAQRGEPHDTIGLGSLRYTPPPGATRRGTGAGYTGTGSPSGGATGRSTGAATTTPKHNFTEDEIAKIKLFSNNGFAPEDLARVHGVSAATIRQVLKS